MIASDDAIKTASPLTLTKLARPSVNHLLAIRMHCIDRYEAV